jgi:DNA-binding Xre family transcriptional regulator
MSISYKPLWHLLVEKKMKKLELRDLVGMSNSTLARLGKDEPVTLEVLEKISIALDCRIENIVEFVKD